jgi:carboxyvinyl-carboxyphosphonate phosphorylmutase
MTIEDTDLPHRFGSEGSPSLISIEEGIGKMKAALDARQDPKLVIAGRTSAPATTDIDDAIIRAKAYEAIGVDAIFFTGVKTREQLEALSTSVHIPIFLGNTPEELADFDYLSASKVRVALQGHLPFMAAVKSVYDTLKSLKDGTPPAELSGTFSQDLMKKVTRNEEYQQWIDEYLTK